jgi:hypothetical protein
VNTLALVSLELIAGSFALMWLTMLLWRVVDRGYYRSTTWVLFPITLALAFTFPPPLRPLGWAFGVMQALYLAAVYSQRPLLEWLTGGVATVAGTWLCLQGGRLLCPGGCTEGAVQAAVGALFLGGVTNGMVLGHWYLNQARLPIEPLKGATRIMLAGIVVSLVAGIAGRSTLASGVVPGGFVAMSAANYWWAWFALTLGTGILGFAVRETVRARSTQSATGLLYIAMLTAMVGQFIVTRLVAT